ncbi:MAG: SpoIIE family protein phosphatase [Phycisphaerales bacterium]|jgi:serine phosphatase RsbU (regulator of sigma subunit)|nr:SpoIIE family protein phosphatase [Phycisphaerales bacterium]
MTTGNLVVLAGVDRLEKAEKLGKALESAWPCGLCPNIVSASMMEAQQDILKGACGLLVLPETADCGTGRNPNLQSMDFAQEAGIPTMIIGDLDCSTTLQLETMQVPEETNPTTIAAILCGMISRQQDLDQLQQQLSIATRIVNSINLEMEKVDEELQAAAVVQRDFLPNVLPNIGPISIGALWRPTSYVSGDYYDVRMIDENRIGVFIADAAGHGVPSAMMTMILARAFEHAHNEHAANPDMVMAAINKDFYQQQSGVTRFATAVYAVVDCSEGLITYASAGHPPPLVLSETELRVLENTLGGGLLGIFPEAEYSVMTESIRPGESFLVHSDGFEQAFPLPTAGPSELTRPTNAYLNVFKSLGEANDPEEMMQRLSLAIDSRRGSLHPCDDLTLLCIHHQRQASAVPENRLKAG